MVIFQSTAFAQNVGHLKKITLWTLNWPPYVGEGLPDMGGTYKLVKKVFEKMGYLIEIEFRPWSRVLIEAKRGKVDGFFPAYYSNERNKLFYMSDPIWGGPIVFLTKRESHIIYKKIKELKKYRIGLVKGYVNTQEIDQADYLEKDYARNDLINIKKLIKGRVDLIVIDKYVAYYLIKKYLPHHIGELKVLSPSIEYKHLYVYFPKKRKNSKKLLKDFNNGLFKLKKDGTIDKIYKKWKEKLIKGIMIENN